MRWMLFVFAVLATSLVHAEEWSRFRGPNGAGVSAESFPEKWTDKDYAWKINLPERGYSSPVAWQKHVYVTSANKKSGERHIVCVEVETGKIAWQRSFADSTYKTHKRNSIATSTPTVDADRLYLAWATPQQYIVQALDRLTGKNVWQIDLGSYTSQHGFGVSPILFEDLLILPNEQDKKGSLHAVEAKTGKKVWTIPRNSGNATYSTPCVYRGADGKAALIFTNWQHGITAVEPRSGKVLWETSVFEPGKQERAIASPIIAGDLVIGTCGFVTAQKHFVAVRPTSDGKVQEVWRMEKAVAYMPTPIVKGDRIYCCSELGIFTTLDAKNGKVIWQERLDAQFSASPILAGNAIYCPANDGEVYVIHAGDTFKLLGKTKLGEDTQSTPTIAGGHLIFRTDTHLMALRSQKKQSEAPGKKRRGYVLHAGMHVILAPEDKNHAPRTLKANLIERGIDPRDIVALDSPFPTATFSNMVPREGLMIYIGAVDPASRVSHDAYVRLHQSLQAQGVTPNDDIIWIGHSAGGQIGMSLAHLAHNLAKHPELAKKTQPYRFQAVITLGSAIGSNPVPTEVQLRHYYSAGDTMIYFLAKNGNIVSAGINSKVTLKPLCEPGQNCKVRIFPGVEHANWYTNDEVIDRILCEFDASHCPAWRRKHAETRAGESLSRLIAARLDASVNFSFEAEKQ